MSSEQKDSTRSTPKGAAKDNGQRPSREYNRFESLMKRIVRVPKKEIDARREAEKKRP